MMGEVTDNSRTEYEDGERNLLDTENMFGVRQALRHKELKQSQGPQTRRILLWTFNTNMI